jgi:hypothetical protein
MFDGYHHGLSTYSATPLLIEFAKLRQLLVQLPFGYELQHQKDPLGIVKVAI